MPTRLAAIGLTLVDFDIHDHSAAAPLQRPARRRCSRKAARSSPIGNRRRLPFPLVSRLFQLPPSVEGDSPNRDNCAIPSPGQKLRLQQALARRPTAGVAAGAELELAEEASHPLAIRIRVFDPAGSQVQGHRHVGDDGHQVLAFRYLPARFERLPETWAG